MQINIHLATERLRRLIDDLEHDESCGNTSAAIEPLLSELRVIRDLLPPKQPETQITYTGVAA